MLVLYENDNRIFDLNTETDKIRFSFCFCKFSKETNYKFLRTIRFFFNTAEIHLDGLRK